jgi:predicted AlkP superfamily phosphohydrolase/phosphomutase
MALALTLCRKYADVMPTMSRMFNHGLVQTSFPSTTATSLATLTTGELPGVHGMLGYTVQVPRSGGRLLNALKWDERVDPENWQPVETLFQRAVKVGISVTHVAAKRYENSGFTRAVFRGQSTKAQM